MVRISSVLLAVALCVSGCSGQGDTQTELPPLNLRLAPDSLFDVSPVLWSTVNWRDSLDLFRVHHWVFDGDSSDVVYRVRADFDGDGTEDVALALGTGRLLGFDVFRFGNGPPRHVGMLLTPYGGLGVCPQLDRRPRIVVDYRRRPDEYDRFVYAVYPDSVSTFRESLDGLLRTDEGLPEDWGRASCECPVVFEEAPSREWLEHGDGMWRPAVFPEDDPGWLASAPCS
ncbi:MAG TPA: hypothetical protein VGB53_11755 [Rubricoccaceae bacterium]|jgi:hypothetical protein